MPNAMIRAAKALLILCVLLATFVPGTSHGRKPRLRLEHLDHSRCARDGVVTAWVAELELEGTLRAPAADSVRLELDDKLLPDPPVTTVQFAATKRPLRLALVVQSSEAFSMDFAAIKAGAKALVRALPERSEIVVIQYADEARRKVAFGTPRAALAALADMDTSDLPGDVALISAMKMALRALGSRPGTRRLLVVVSDGLNESPKRDLFRALGDSARKAGVLIHPIAYSPVDERSPLLNLGEIAKRSEGTLRWARRPEALAEQFSNLSHEINRQLGLAFKVPDRCAAKHKVRIISGRLRSRTVQVPPMQPVKQQGTGKTGAAKKPGQRGKHTWVVIPVGLVLVLVAALFIWLVARRWRVRHGRGASPPEDRVPPRASAPAGPAPSEALESRLLSTGDRPVTLRPEPGLQATGPRRIPPVQTSPVGPSAMGPGPAAPMPTGPMPVPFDELPTTAPGDAMEPELPIGVLARAAFISLVGCAPPLQGWQVELPQGDPFIGTAPDCFICLDPSLGVSTYHARLHRQAGQLTIEDLESRAGLFVNYQHVGQATLSDGDVVQLGQAMFQVKIA